MANGHTTVEKELRKFLKVRNMLSAIQGMITYTTPMKLSTAQLKKIGYAWP